MPAQPHEGGPDQVVTSGPTGAAPPDGPVVGGRRVVPAPGLADPRPTCWARAESAAGGRALLVTFWGTPCHLLAGVRVSEDDRTVTITVLEAVDPAHGGRPCLQPAEELSVEVPLGGPLAGRRVVDGAR